MSSRTELYDEVVDGDVTSLSALDVVERMMVLQALRHSSMKLHRR